MYVRTLQPPDLRGGAVTFVVAGGYAKYYCRFRRIVHMSVTERHLRHDARVGFPAIYTDECELGLSWCRILQ